MTLDRIARRGDAIAADARRETIARLVTAARDTWPEAVIETTAEAVVIAGPAMGTRLFDDARLRWIASLIR